MSVRVRYGDYVGEHKLNVAKGSGPPLLGRDWLKNIRLDWMNIKRFSAEGHSSDVKELINRYSEVFQGGLGTMKHVRAHLTLKEGASPKFHGPHPVPFAIREVLSQELARLEEEGILRKVEHSDWASPIVPVPKRDRSIRICGDYKVSINPMLKIDQHPLPNPTELLASLAGGKHFTKLDLTAAYQQLLLDEESSKLVTISTHKGLYEYTRLPFGAASAPAVFQQAMDTILQGVPRVFCYLDDILITGCTEIDHLRTLLVSYRYDIQYCKGEANENADALSCLPSPDSPLADGQDDASVFNVMQLNPLPIQADAVARATHVESYAMYEEDGQIKCPTLCAHFGGRGMN